MRTCYCKETNKEYGSISECIKALNLPQNKYARLTSSLKISPMVEVSGYHIGYSKEAVEQQLEEWKQPAPDLDIEVNKNGELRKKSTKIPKQPTYDSQGYLYVMLNSDKGYKAFRVHRLVCQAFIPEFDTHLVVDHLNGIRDDNRLENLCPKTQAENMLARDMNNKPLYDELRRIIIKYGYEKTYEILSQL